MAVTLKPKPARKAPFRVRLLEAQMAIVRDLIAEWQHGTSDDRNHADDLLAALDKVAVAK